MPRRTLWTWVLLLSAAAGVGVVSWSALRGEAGPGAPPSPQPAHVVTLTVESKPLRVEHRFTGEVWALSESALSVAESGRVRRVNVVDGSKVKQGQVLLELDDTLARAELREARASEQRYQTEHSRATVEAERFEALERERVVSNLEAERQKTTAAALGAQRDTAEAAVGVRARRVERHRIIAPFDGTVARRFVAPGDWLAPGDTAFQLVTDERVEVLVRVPAHVLEQLDNVKATRLVAGERSVPAIVANAVDALDRITRTALVRLEPSARPSWLRAGSSVQAVFELERSDGVVVPRDALVYGVAGVNVVRVAGGKAEFVGVEVLEATEKDALIAEGAVRAGDELVIRGNERLRPGQPVVVGRALAGVATKKRVDSLPEPEPEPEPEPAQGVDENDAGAGLTREPSPPGSSAPNRRK